MAHVPLRSLFLLAIAAMTSACDGNAEASCFLPEATPPTRAAMFADSALGASSRDLASALFDRELDRAEALLRADSALARVRVGASHDMLSVALASCEPRAVTLLVRHGARPDGEDGRGVPLSLAMLATDPALAHALMTAGASPTPAGNPLGLFRTAIAAGSLGGVRMLIDFRGDVNVADRLGHRPLLIALDTERFRIAEMLLERGADPWAIDSTGGNLGTAVYTPMVTSDGEEADAQRRLRSRLSPLGWPAPPPSPAKIRELALKGEWPPAGVNASPMSDDLRRVLAENAR